MADRYWVGGTAGWDNAANVKWATTSGGAGGASIPTTADDVFFDANSTGTCTISSGNTGAKSINCTGFTGGIAGTGSINVAGSITLVAGMTYTHTGQLQISGTGTLTTAGKAFSTTIVGGTGITVTLGDALTIHASGFLAVSNGSFDAANYNVTAPSVLSATALVRTITMGSGLWTLTGTGTVWGMPSTTNLTLNKDTANILLSNTTTSSRTFGANALSLNKLTIGGATGTSTTTFGGAAGTGSSFTEIASTKTVAHTISIAATGNGMTVGTWSVTGTAGNVVTLNSSTVATQRNFNLTNVTSGIDYLSVKDIGVNQADRFYVGANSTNGGNNSNVIFTAPPAPIGNTGAFFSIL